MMEIAPNILASQDPQQSLKEILKNLKYSRLAVIVDENTAQHCLPLVHNVMGEALVVTIPSGEINKNIETCTKVWEALTTANFDRKALLINLGGGVIGDLGGFCAATYKRGIRFINIPTTLLSQVDASVGGKLGVDFLHYKNQIGLFQEPEYVLISPTFLRTLPPNEMLSGYAEVVKHALIADAGLWNELMSREVQEMMRSEPIARAVRIKYNIVRQDFHENHQRKLLNFGHTLGHAVESYLLQNSERQVLHGEAVAAGMLMESYISFKRELISEEEFIDIRKYLLKIFPYIPLEARDVNEITAYLIQDKKNIDGNLMFTLLKDIGVGIFDQQVFHQECMEALDFYINLKD